MLGVLPHRNHVSSSVAGSAAIAPYRLVLSISVAGKKPNLVAFLVGENADAVVFLLEDPALVVEGPVDQGRLHQVDLGETGRGHGPSMSAGARLLGGSRRGDRGAGGVPVPPETRSWGPCGPPGPLPAGEDAGGPEGVKERAGGAATGDRGTGLSGSSRSGFIGLQEIARRRSPGSPAGYWPLPYAALGPWACSSEVRNSATLNGFWTTRLPDRHHVGVGPMHRALRTRPSEEAPRPGPWPRASAQADRATYRR